MLIDEITKLEFTMMLDGHVPTPARELQRAHIRKEMAAEDNELKETVDRLKLLHDQKCGIQSLLEMTDRNHTSMVFLRSNLDARKARQGAEGVIS